MLINNLHSKNLKVIHFLNVNISDGGSTTIALKNGVPARSLLNNVASRRGLSPGCIDWLLLNEGSNTDSLSLDADSMCLSGRHIRGELRVTFRCVRYRIDNFKYYRQ